MLITHDMGPLLIAGYAAGAFVAASVAMWWYQRRGAIGRAPTRSPSCCSSAWIAGDDRRCCSASARSTTSLPRRLENLAAPLASANDQLALVTWFQRAAPAAGFGPGAVPWCGFGRKPRMRGRAGADPERLHVHRARRRIRLGGGLGADDRLLRCGCTLLIRTSRHARRAASRASSGACRRMVQRRPGVPELALRRRGSCSRCASSRSPSRAIWP